MTNEQLILKFLEGKKFSGKSKKLSKITIQGEKRTGSNHSLSFCDLAIYSYDSCMAMFTRSRTTLMFNPRLYKSRTTSRHIKLLKHHATRLGIEVI